MAAAAPLPALVNAHDGVQIGGCMAFSKSKARATPGLTPGACGLRSFSSRTYVHEAEAAGRRGVRGVGAGDENRRQVSAGCQYGWRGRPSRSTWKEMYSSFHAALAGPE